jgi:hypothetical protein
VPAKQQDDEPGRTIRAYVDQFDSTGSPAVRGFKTGHYAKRYMAEFQYRFNRRFDLARLMPSLLASCAYQRPATKAAIRTAMPAELGA